MAVLTALRLTLAADLAPLGIAVHPAWPDDLELPCAFITPPIAAPYLIAGQTFGTFTASLDLVIMVDHTDGVTALTQLEALIEAAAVNTADWLLTGVDAPAPMSASEGGAEYLASIIHLSKSVRIEGA